MSGEGSKGTHGERTGVIFIDKRDLNKTLLKHISYKSFIQGKPDDGLLGHYAAETTHSSTTQLEVHQICASSLA
jgi:hypothetical protein